VVKVGHETMKYKLWLGHVAWCHSSASSAN